MPFDDVARAWRRFWFTPAPPTNLAIGRVVFFGGLTLFYLPHDFSGWADVSAALWQPIWLFEWFHIPVLSQSTLAIIQAIWKLSLLLACLGCFTAVSTGVVALLGTYLLGLPHNFGQTYHFDAILVIAFWILAFSRAGDAWSIDALRRSTRADHRPPVLSTEYHWPIQLIVTTLSLVFFAAGVAKLRASGYEWFASNHFRILLDRVQYHISDADPIVSWGSTIARLPWLPNLMAFTTVVVETAYPLALVSRTLRVPLVVGGIVLILGIRALMGPTFENFLLINVFWVPWDRVLAWAASRIERRAARPTAHARSAPDATPDRVAEPEPALAAYPVDLSVIIPTYNRADGLRPLLERLADQDADGVTYDVFVVDNNSRDDTRTIVTDFIRHEGSGRFHYVFEPRQGVSYARNSGVASSRGPIVAFLDDDGIPGADWVRSMTRAFEQYPEADCIAGRVRPNWTIDRPSWLTDAHAGPVALQDRTQQAWVNQSNASPCLLTANLGCRRKVFNEVGGFSPDYPRNQDREFELRLWRAGKQGLYLPAMDVVTEVPRIRVTKRYHRRWQMTTGKYHALMRYRDMLDPQGRLIEERPEHRFLGTPLFLYRECFGRIVGWMGAALRGESDQRFLHETRLWYFAGFFGTRFKTDVLHGFGDHHPPMCDRLS